MKEFKEFWLSLAVDERPGFAVRCGTSVGHLRNIAYGKPCAEKLAIAIERESGGEVRCETLRPDVDWAYLRNTDLAIPGDRREGERRAVEPRREERRDGDRRARPA